MGPLETERYKNSDIVIEIYPDMDPSNPRTEWDHIATMVCAHRKYTLGDHQLSGEYMPGPIEWITRYESLQLWCRSCDEMLYDEDWHDNEDSTCNDPKPYVKETVYMLPLYLFDHSGISMSTSKSEFQMWDSAGWDWGCVGFIYMTEATAKQNWPGLNGEELANAAIECMVAEVQEYDQYLTGDVYGYVIYYHGETLDSCWGFFGIDAVREEAHAAAKYHYKQLHLLTL